MLSWHCVCRWLVLLGAVCRHACVMPSSVTLCVYICCLLRTPSASGSAAAHAAAAVPLSRKAHKKDQVTEVARKKRRTAGKATARAIVGVSLEVINKKRTEKPEVRQGRAGWGRGHCLAAICCCCVGCGGAAGMQLRSRSPWTDQAAAGQGGGALLSAAGCCRVACSCAACGYSICGP